MSKIGLAILLILMAGRNYAQQDYFILIQADNNQPFYVRMEGKLFSSSAQGHLILSQLKEGSYSITVGFPKQLFPEQLFSVSIYKKDLEFQLKDLGEKGWGLYNPQTLELKKPDEKKETEPGNHLEGVKKDDAFSRLMAGVVSDTAVMYNTYTMEAALKDSPVTSKSAPADTQPPVSLPVTAPSNATTAGASGKDTAAATMVNPSSGTETAKETLISRETARPDSTLRSDTGTLAGRVDTAKTIAAVAGTGRDSTLRKRDSLAAAAIPESTSSVAGSTAAVPPGVISSVPSSTAAVPETAAALPKAGLVVKLSERKTTKGVRLVYADHIKGKKADTIVVIIPVDTVTRLAQRPAETASLPSPPAGSDTPALASGGANHPTSTLASMTTKPDSGQKKTTTPVRSLFINSDCRNFATEYDVDKLRVKMLEAGKDEDRIAVAHKVFKSKCFSTRQIKALSEVFTSDAQKFRFLETAYPFVSDDHFKELAELLADPVYSSKFRTMTGQ
ncbi:MAG TPA: DUF4476 domain-containing protein [Puia sp.]|nr:DUF4476 domain-containing protein [Puia sp.]